MGIGYTKMWYWFVRWFIPKRLMYFCFMSIMAHATTGKYSDTVVPDLTGLKAIARFSKDFNL